MPEVLPEDISKGIAAILWDDLGLSEKQLLKSVAESLKATRHIGFNKDGRKLTHPDHKERREAAKDLLALLGVIVPSKAEVRVSAEEGLSNVLLQLINNKPSGLKEE